jgi:K+-transporting ATPase ATPase B chain
VAKYFAIIPAIFATAYPQLAALNIMKLATPQSAVLSAVIFNALIIVALVPLALRGVAYRPVGAGAILRRNLVVYGLGGLVAPFLGIKIIDFLLVSLGVRRRLGSRQTKKAGNERGFGVMWRIICRAFFFWRS